MTPCPWYVGGPLLGLIVVGLQWAGNMPLGMTGAIGDTLDFASRREKRPNWRVYFFCGVLVGAWIFSRISGGADVTFAHGSFDSRFGLPLWGKAGILGLAGALIGFGARTAGGCTSGAGLCGVPRLSKGAIVTTLSFVVVAMAVAQWVNRVFPG